MAVTTLVDPLVGLWRRRVDTPVRRALLALTIAAVFGAAHLARLGTTAGRAGAAVGLALLVVVLVARLWRERRLWSDIRRTLGRLLSSVDAGLASRTLRAVTLVERADAGQLESSPALAHLHFERLLAQVTPQVLERTAATSARRWRWVGAGLALVGALALLVAPLRVLEGLDVLVAHRRVAPLPMVWLHYPTLLVEPPSYLRETPRLVLLGSVTTHPSGAVLTVRGQPSRNGRRLVLTDGSDEVPFVSDAAGGVVATWTLKRDATLRVAARFGDVIVPEPESVDIRVVADQAPEVKLQGAPREVALLNLDRIELFYEARDDHGLSQIDLVIREGHREDRRVLSRHNGESRVERGGHVLSVADPFLRRIFLPTRVTIEARDNDPLEGSKWGRSEALTLLPPPLGAPEAHRLEQIAAARDGLVDLLGWWLQVRDVTASVRRTRLEDASQQIEAALAHPTSLPVPPGLRAFLRGQARALVQPLPTESRRQRRIEDVLLAVDVAVERLANRDARTVATRLADVAEETAAAARQTQDDEERQPARARLDAAILALRAGGEQLLQLGMLGRDLGSVVHGDLDRVVRSRDAEDWRHAELAATHLAARLRRPNPSFGSRHRGGVESGGGLPADTGEASQADQRFDELARELEQLALEHATSISGVERALGEATRNVDQSDFEQEARERAEELRRTVAELPSTGHDPGSARAAAAIGREHANAMSQSLERLALEDAAESGRRALAALEEAQRKGREARQFDWVDPESVARARERLREDIRWAEDRLRQIQHQAEANAREQLQRAGRREHQHAQRAGDLSNRGRESQTSLPDGMLRSLEQAEALMNDAARELQAGRGDRALLLQRDAQRLIEQSSVGQTTANESTSRDRRHPRDDGGVRGPPSNAGSVPKDSEDKSRDFRQRVVDGLRAEQSGRLSPAVHRYAEGLLR